VRSRSALLSFHQAMPPNGSIQDCSASHTSVVWQQEATPDNTSAIAPGGSRRRHSIPTKILGHLLRDAFLRYRPKQLAAHAFLVIRHHLGVVTLALPLCPSLSRSYHSRSRWAPTQPGANKQSQNKTAAPPISPIATNDCMNGHRVEQAGYLPSSISHTGKSVYDFSPVFSRGAPPSPHGTMLVEDDQGQLRLLAA
jgi:hypothetical protein